MPLTELTVLYCRMWLHVLTNYMVILRPLVHITPKPQLQISFLVSVGKEKQLIILELYQNAV